MGVSDTLKLAAPPRSGAIILGTTQRGPASVLLSMVSRPRAPETPTAPLRGGVDHVVQETLIATCAIFIAMRLRGIPLVVFFAMATISCSNQLALPDVVGEDVQFARGILIGEDLLVSVRDEVVSGVPVGQVLRSEPESGSEVDPGSEIVLYVAKSPEYEIRGEFTLMDTDTGGSNSNCRGTGGYDDIKSGLSVTVRDGSGGVLATGRLGDGKRPSVWCTFEFSVGGLPEVEFYSVEVGRRGELTYSFEEMADNNWEVVVSLG